MYLEHRIGAILLMGGMGQRFGSPIPKQFHKLNEKRIYRYALDTFLETQYFDEIILVCPAAWIKTVQEEIPHFVRTAAGGATRQESSYAGLKAFQNPPGIVLIHDAVRPFVSKKIIQDNLEQAISQGAADTCIPSADTLIISRSRLHVEKIPERTHYMRGQTPQTFRYPLILEAHETARQRGIENASDDCQLILSLGRPVAIAQGSEENFKITSELDLAIAMFFLNERYIHNVIALPVER
jgi:2-C-methyl-D-erythritol 4-phosphate cytidylyltransferase